MPFRCSVPNCKGNYQNGPKVHVFSFPKDDKLKQKWLHAIKRKDFLPTKSSKVCELHFRPEEIKRTSSAYDENTGKLLSCNLKFPQLSSDAVPSQLPNCPKYLSGPSTSTRLSRDQKLEQMENDLFAEALAESEQEFSSAQQKDKLDSLLDIKAKLNNNIWHIMDKHNEIVICHIDTKSSIGPAISCAAVVDENLNMNVFMKSVKLSELGEYQFPLQLSCLTTLETVLKSLLLDPVEHSEPAQAVEVDFLLKCKLVLSLLLTMTGCSQYENVIWFLSQQIKIIIAKRPSYSPDFLVFSSVFYGVSPHAYKFIRKSGNCLLPSYSTVRRLTLSCSMSPLIEQDDRLFLSYIKMKFKALESCSKTVMLLVDEIHLKPFFDYKGGNIVGSAYHSSNAATTAFAFMISSLFSNFKDVVHILPSCKMSHDLLFGLIKKIIVGLEEIGFKVNTVITDNNSINRKAMSMFANPTALSIVYPHPFDPKRPLFFLFDTVHILKCVRNNWLNQKSEDRSMIIPAFKFGDLSTSNSQTLHASFETIRKTYYHESASLLKFSYTLSMKALNPSSFERQNVKLALQIFNDYVAQAVMHLGEEHSIQHHHDTSVFLRIFTTWWKIVNVKTPMKGRRLNSDFENPLTSEDSLSKKFLEYLHQWLIKWNSMNGRIGKLTRETSSALIHTTSALLEISEYCLNELGAKYILLGKFQTDCLEARFGQYRRLSGCKYDVSLRQVFECEKKIRMLSVLEITLNDEKITLNDFSIDWTNYSPSLETLPREFLQSITPADFVRSEKFLPVITYLAGYCCYSVHKKLKCTECKDRIICPVSDVNNINNSYINAITRGGLLYPHQSIVRIVQLNYLIIDKLSATNDFQRSSNQRQLALEAITSAIWDDDDNLLSSSVCGNGHEMSKLTMMTCWASTNALLNNFCRKENDALVHRKFAKKRKLQTLNS